MPGQSGECRVLIDIHNQEASVLSSGGQEEPRLSISEQQNLNHLRILKEESAKLTNDQSSKPKPLIQRVPSILRENKHFDIYFKPKVVALGPLHHANTKLQLAEKAKLELAADFIRKHGVAEETLYKQIKNEIEELKKCYRRKDIRRYDDMKLAWMLFVDGCAVLHAIECAKSKSDQEEETNQKQKIDQQQNQLNIKGDLLAFALQDLFLLENQLPYRVLEILMKSLKDDETVMKESIWWFIDEKIKNTIALGNDEKQKQDGTNEKKTDAPHLLGLLRERLLLEDPNTSKTQNSMSDFPFMSRTQTPMRTFRSINELKESGVRVRCSETSSLKAVSFKRWLPTLRIPRIVVDDSTGSKFLNLVAYEMCPDFKNNYQVISYLCFLDSLIDTAQDVKVLRHEGMLQNYMGSDEKVAHLFNNITTDLVPDLEAYKDVTISIQNYCNSGWATFLAKFYYTHFSSPWSIGAFLGVLMGLLFSAIQAYYAMQRSIAKSKK